MAASRAVDIMTKFLWGVPELERLDDELGRVDAVRQRCKYSVERRVRGGQTDSTVTLWDTFPHNEQRRGEGASSSRQ